MNNLVTNWAKWCARSENCKILLRKIKENINKWIVLCYGLHCAPPTYPNSYVEILTPQTPQNATAFGDRNFRDVAQMKWGHYSGVLIPQDPCPCQRRKRDSRHAGRGMATWGHRRRGLSTAQGERPREPCQPLDLGLLASAIMRK